MFDSEDGVSKLTLRLARPIADEDARDRVATEFKIMCVALQRLAKVDKLTHELLLDVGGDGVGLLELDLTGVSEEQAGAIQGIVSHHLGKIGEILSVDGNDIKEELSFGPFSAPAPTQPPTVVLGCRSGAEF